MDFKPELMVLGDSLSQGCRSLSVTSKYCRESWGARIAASQDWRFDTPDHPRPVLFDLERIVRRFNLVLGPIIPLIAGVRVLKGIEKNANAWRDDLAQKQVRSSFETFSNLGVAGAVIPELYEMTYASARDRAFELMADRDLSDLSDLTPVIGELHRVLNYAFVLNPAHKTNLQHLTPLDWVARRKPTRLMIQTGHNHGLWDAGFTANYKLVSYAKLRDQAGIEEMAERLARLPAGVEQIVYFLLPKVGAVANLIPKGDLEDGYYDEYAPALVPVPEVQTRVEMASIDASVQKTNQEIRERFTEIFNQVKPNNAKRLTFVDTYQVFDRYDYKNSRNPAAKVRVSGKGITNERLDGKSRYSGPPSKRISMGVDLYRGGFQSFDGMHPSGVGYALLASEVMDKLDLPHDRGSILKRAFKDDKLLSNYPQQSEAIYGIVNLIQMLRRGGSDEKPEKARGEVDFEDLMEICGAPYCKR